MTLEHYQPCGWVRELDLSGFHTNEEHNEQGHVFARCRRVYVVSVVTDTIDADESVSLRPKSP